MVDFAYTKSRLKFRIDPNVPIVDSKICVKCSSTKWGRALNIFWRGYYVCLICNDWEYQQRIG